MKYLFYSFLLFTIWGNAMEVNKDRAIKFEMVLNAPVEDVYKAWTSPEGIQSFFAPGCDLEMKLYGNYHIYFDPSAKPGEKGAEDEILISFQKNKMLSFTWGFPPSLMELRKNQKTIVTLRFEEIDDNTTKFYFTQSGWGEGELWDKGFEYFKVAWGNVVLARLQYRFEHGPVDWKSSTDYSNYNLVKK